MTYGLKVLLAFDQMLNAILGGHPDESFSSRCYRWRRDKHWLGFMEKVVNTIFFFDFNHCYHAYESERLARHQPPELRK